MLAVTVAVSAGYGFWYAKVSDKSREVAEVQSQIVVATENVSRVVAARAALAKIADDEAKVQSYFVPEASVVAFINNLEALSLSQKTELNVLSVSTGGTSTHPTLRFTLSIKGTFDAVMRTVGAIEYAPYGISVSGLSVAQDAKDIWHAALDLSVGSVVSAAAPKMP